MKSKLVKNIIKVIVIIIIIVSILLSSNLLYELAVKYNVIENKEDVANTLDSPSNTIIVSENEDIVKLLNILYPIDVDNKYSKNFSSQFNGVEAYINEETVNILVRSEATKHFSGLISNSYFEGNESIRADINSKKKVKTLLVGYYLDVLSSEFMKDVPYIFLLMEDGTVEYVDLKILLKNGYLTNPATKVKTKGKIKELSNIIKLEQCNLTNEEDGYSTTVAINSKGEIFNIFDYIKWGQ